jgi:hypothetical protein
MRIQRLMVRDARRCRAPHHEELAALILRSALLRASRRMWPPPPGRCAQASTSQHATDATRGMLSLLSWHFMTIGGKGFAEGGVRPASGGIYMTSAAGHAGLLSVRRQRARRPRRNQYRTAGSQHDSHGSGQAKSNPANCLMHFLAPFICVAPQQHLILPDNVAGLHDQVR